MPDPKLPVDCFDESPTQLIGEVRQPTPAKPGQPQRYDYEYSRKGTANLFVFLDAHRSWREVKITDQRTAADFADCMRDLAEVHYPKAELIRVMMDNLSTHTAGALSEAFPAPQARRLLQRLEFHYTPKHASWLNMVDIEISVLCGQCLDQRIGERERLLAEVKAWQQQPIPPAPGSNGCSPPSAPATNSSEPIPSSAKSRNHCAEVLGRVDGFHQHEPAGETDES